MEDAMSAAICGLLSELEEKGWKIDYSRFAGEVQMVLLSNAEVRSMFVFDADTDRVGVAFRVDTACVKNAHTENFIVYLKNHLKIFDEIKFVSETPGTFQIAWNVHRPQLFESENESDYAQEFWAQFEHCRIFVLSYTHILEVLGSRPKLRLVAAKERIPAFEHLVAFCLLEQPRQDKLH